MMAGITWTMSMKRGPQKAHIAYTHGDRPIAYCGVAYSTWSRTSILDYEVCKKCLKSSEQWAR